MLRAWTCGLTAGELDMAQLRPPKNPSLPTATPSYSRQMLDQTTSALRNYFNQLDAVLQQLARRPYVISVDAPGTPTSNEIVFHHIFNKLSLGDPTTTVTFNADLYGSYWKADTAATAQTDFLLKKTTAAAVTTTVGTVRFAAAATTATFVGFAQTQWVDGDTMTLVAPNVPDASISGLYGSLLGYR